MFKATQQDISSNQIKNTRKKLQYIKPEKMHSWGSPQKSGLFMQDKFMSLEDNLHSQLDTWHLKKKTFQYASNQDYFYQ